MCVVSIYCDWCSFEAICLNRGVSFGRVVLRSLLSVVLNNVSKNRAEVIIRVDSALDMPFSMITAQFTQMTYDIEVLTQLVLQKISRDQCSQS